MDKVALGGLILVSVVALGLLLGGGVDVFSDAGWEDLRSPANSIRLGGSSPATSVAYRGGEVISFAKNVNQYVYVDSQMPHSWEEGTDIVAHIHWTIPVSGLNGVNSENVKWDITYSWANMDAAFPVASSSSITVNVKAVSSDVHLLTSWTPFSGVGKIQSSMLIISIKRDTSVADNYDNAVYLTEFDIHFRQNRIGSPTIP